jgi:predicted DNA-binding transcriptional regulator YafY
MPHKDKKSTLIRQWEMLKLLPTGSGGPWMKASEIASRLENNVHEISVRTVQRDLKELSAIFPIELNDKNPRDYGWRWMKGAHVDIPGLNISEALAMRLVETHLKQLMPSSMLDALQGVFSQAKSRLEQVSKPSEWLAKVKVVQPNQPLIPPKIDEASQDAIYKALLENRRITASYCPPWMEEAKEYVLNPLGLIMRGPVSYLVATAWDYEDPRLYAMHRFGKAEILDEECRIPEGFDLEREIASGFADFAGGGAPIHLEFLCEESSAAYLEETPLSEDQEMAEAEEGWVRINATVNATWQLRWWLLSKGASIEVLCPDNLRKEIAEELQEASGYYADAEDSSLMEKGEAAAERLEAITGNNEHRDPARIAVMLEAIREKWVKEPDLRLAQLIVNAISPSEPCPQVYYFEDEQLMSKLKYNNNSAD